MAVMVVMFGTFEKQIVLWYLRKYQESASQECRR